VLPKNPLPKNPLPRTTVAIEEITVDDLADRLEAGAVLLDVREARELTQVRVPGVHHIPLGELMARAYEIPQGELLVICRSGVRSMTACQQLGTIGRTAANVAGGTIAWVSSGRPTESG
jgi:rhodanese-related sulfurtransferase